MDKYVKVYTLLKEGRYVMVNVKLKNPGIILTPINDEERKQIVSMGGDISIYVLYRLPNSEGIHIGMMSPTLRNFFPAIANVRNLEYATSKAFFYTGDDFDLKNNLSQIADRPVYGIRPTDDRMVSDYDVLNGTDENGLNILLEDVVDGNYSVNEKTPSELKKSR